MRFKREKKKKLLVQITSLVLFKNKKIGLFRFNHSKQQFFQLNPQHNNYITWGRKQKKRKLTQNYHTFISNTQMHNEKIRRLKTLSKAPFHLIQQIQTREGTLELGKDAVPWG